MYLCGTMKPAQSSADSAVNSPIMRSLSSRNRPISSSRGTFRNVLAPWSTCMAMSLRPKGASAVALLRAPANAGR